MIISQYRLTFKSKTPRKDQECYYMSSFKIRSKNCAIKFSTPNVCNRKQFQHISIPDYPKILRDIKKIWEEMYRSVNFIYDTLFFLGWSFLTYFSPLFLQCSINHMYFRLDKKILFLDKGKILFSKDQQYLKLP